MTDQEKRIIAYHNRLLEQGFGTNHAEQFTMQTFGMTRKEVRDLVSAADWDKDSGLVPA